MTFRITHVRFDNPLYKSYETITAYAWIDETTNINDSDWKLQMVAKVEGGKRAFVGTGTNRVEATVVTPAQGKKFLRTQADSTSANNLLNLPTF
jgi:hypothetical protein